MFQRFHLGSTVALSDAAGQAVGRVQYDPYGEVITSTLPITLTDRLFTGARFDGTIGLYLMGARWYDPALGRWIQADTIVPEPLSPQAWNRYSYAYNSPTNYIDPSGHLPIWDILDIGSFFWSGYEFFREPSWANLGWWALDAVSLLPLIPSLGLLRHGDEAADLLRAAGRMEDVGDARRVIVELGSGDFTNLPRIIAENPGARVIGIEHPEMRTIIELAQQHPGVASEWDEIVRGYEAALEAGAEIHFLDFGRGLPFRADEIISIAPNPSSAHDVVRAISSSVRPQGRIYVACVASESTADIIARGLSSALGMSVTPRTIPIRQVRYPSSYFGEFVRIIDIITP